MRGFRHQQNKQNKRKESDCYSCIQFALQLQKMIEQNLVLVFVFKMSMSVS
eukprot:m.61747 g.61747  ORF g.61747 m.61747 type:complete len:51 (-) comp13355_c1_seq2:441-593(-)